MPGVLIVEAMAQTGAIAVLVEEENRGKIAFFAGIDDCRFKRVVEPGDVLTLACEIDTDPRPDRAREGDGARRRRARCARDADVRGGAMIGTAQGVRIGITGLGVHVPAKVMTNDGARRDRGHVGRVDSRADRHQGAAHRLRGRGADGHRASRCARGARGCRRRRGGHRPPHLRDGDAGHDVPDLLRAPRGRARDAARSGLRPSRRLHGVRLRDRAGVRDARVGALATRARGRWRRALEDPRLGGPLDARPLRGRRRCGRHGAGRAGRVHRLRARRGRRRGRVPVVSRAPARGTSRTRTRS